MTGHFRVARHTESIDKVKHFYINILGLDLIGEFDHDGYLGVFIGEKDKDWHLEFTQSSDAPRHSPDEEDVLVFYLGATKAYNLCIKRFEDNGLVSVQSKNPYWDKWGKTFIDPDGYRVVICHRDWSNE